MRTVHIGKNPNTVSGIDRTHVCAPAQNPIDHRSRLRSGERSIRMKCPVGISVDPALGCSGKNDIVSPVRIIYIGKRPRRGGQFIEIRQYLYEFRSGNLGIRLKIAAVAVHHTVFHERLHRLAVPRGSADIAEIRVLNSFRLRSVRQQRINHLRRLGPRKSGGWMEQTVAAAVHILHVIGRVKADGCLRCSGRSIIFFGRIFAIFIGIVLLVVADSIRLIRTHGIRSIFAIFTDTALFFFASRRAAVCSVSGAGSFCSLARICYSIFAFGGFIGCRAVLAFNRTAVSGAFSAHRRRLTRKRPRRQSVLFISRNAARQGRHR